MKTKQKTLYSVHFYGSIILSNVADNFYLKVASMCLALIVSVIIIHDAIKKIYKNNS